MSVDNAYSPVPYVYIDRGLVARNIEDQVPDHCYLQAMNTLARAENSLSSRYGCQIINRDPAGTGVTNHLFTSPVTSLSKLAYQGGAYRYAGLADGQLWRRPSNTQGAYTQIYSGLSGQPFDSLVTNCFETSQAYNFIADQAVSLKDNGTLAAPQLWGIDPPAWTANAQPFSPLLTLIDNFASGNTYSGGSGSLPSGWGYSLITTLTATSALEVTDFFEFLGGTSFTIEGGTATSTQSSVGSNSSTSTSSGFSSLAISPVDTVTLTLTASGSFAFTSFLDPEGNATASFSYSTDGGATFTNIFSPSSVTPGSFGPAPLTVTVVGLSNLNQLQVRVTATAVFSSGTGSVGATGTAASIMASVVDPGYFGDICNGILSNLNTNSTINVPIVSIESSGLTNGVYTTLIITCGAAHGLTGTPLVAVYGSSNDLADGFYTGTVTGATTLTVTFVSVNAIGATGGILYGGAAAPVECVLTNEYAAPYPVQFSAWGFYQQVPDTTTAFPVGCFSGSVATNSNAYVGNTVALNLSINNQATDDDLIVLTLKVGTPANIENIRLEFDVNGSGYTSSYYYKDISPAFYQGGVDQSSDAYSVTQSQILADTLGLITGQTPNTTAAQVQPGNFSTGSDAWTAVYLRRGDFVPVGQAGQSGLDWTNITGWQVDITTTVTPATGTDGSSTVAMNGLYFQWGYGPSSFGGVGYDYRYTYYNVNTGTESSPSPEMFFGGIQFGYLSSQSAPFYLRQAVQVNGQYSFDTQVTHVRIYRRGGTLNSNWAQIDQIPNVTTLEDAFFYKDVIPDAFIEQSPLLVLDNDPPVTSSLLNPIQTTLSAATTGPGNLYYQEFSPQLITVAQSDAVFVPNQLVEIGTAANLEITAVVTGGTGQFTAIVRLQHNQGEPVNVFAVPRQPCNLCALAYDQVWLAGDKNNPHYLYFSKKGLPENFGPEDYIPVGSPNFPINAVINWRGTLIVGTLETWWIIVGGASPYPQPTGSEHGVVAQQGWCQVEGAIWYRSSDGIREFTGADGKYMTLPVEWIFRGNPMCLPPQADTTQASQDILAFYNNTVFDSYVSLNNDGQRYRLIWDTQYQRFRNDDQPATAMLWEKDTNQFLIGKQVSPGNYAVVFDQVGDYDDGGWNVGALVQTPINLTIQSPYRDLGKPHQQKNWNGLETDVNTQGQVLNTTLLFEDGSISVPLATINTGTTRQKAESVVNAGDGQEAYRASILHTMAVTVAPTLYQESIDATILPPAIASWDSYDLKFGTDDSKFAKESYWDYTSSVPINVSLYADDSYPVPYFTFQLPALPNRAVVRVRHGNLNSGTTAFTLRAWRAIALAVTETDPLQTFMFWNNPKVLWKPVGQHSYQIKELVV